VNSPRKVALYVDGFNFYYGVTNHFRKDRDKRGYSLSGLCWTDFRALVERHYLQPGDRLTHIRYFTAPVTAAVESTTRPGERNRYETWMKAVRSITGLEVISGFYKPGKAEPGESAKSRDEKQTDVNLAVELLLDGLGGVYDQAYVLSGDTDEIPSIIAAAYRMPKALRVCALLPPAQNLDDWKKRYCEAVDAIKRRTELKVIGPNQVGAQVLNERQLANSLLRYELPDVSCPAYWRLPGNYLQAQCEARWRPSE
jgi:hypothetical protein